MSDSPVAVLYDSAGNPIEVVERLGDHYVGVASIQDVHESTGNSSDDNLAAGASFTGTADTTLGVAGLQVNIIASQPIRISIQQSMDGINWDIQDDFDTYADRGDGRTIQATAAYIRVVATNIGPATTTYFRLQTVLCPVVEALPRALTPDGRLFLGTSTQSYYPSSQNFRDPIPRRALVLDSERNLGIRGPVLTDETSFREDFPGTELYTVLTGTLYFSNGGTSVQGLGTSFLGEIKLGQYVKLNSDDDEYLAVVQDIYSDTNLTLEDAYGGSTGNGAGDLSNWVPVVTEDGTISVSSSAVEITSGTTDTGMTSIYRHGDYPPYLIGAHISVDQRIANTQMGFGFMDDYLNVADNSAALIFSGTDDTKVIFHTSSDSANYEETIVTLPNGATTDSDTDYQIAIESSKVVFWINGIRLAEHNRHIPGPYSEMDLRIGALNSGTPASSTTMSVDTIWFANFDRLDVGLTPESLPLPVKSIRSTISTTSNVGGAAADTELLAENEIRLGATVYNDSSAILYLKLGTGASLTSFTVRLTPYAYYEVPCYYSGAIHGYWATSTGNARVTELT